MTEIWKDIPNYENYQVSTFGNVKSFKIDIEGRLLKPSKVLGYYQVSLSDKGEVKQVRVHQLVCVAFLNHVINGNKLVCNHKNFNKLDNRLENLEVVTHRKNLSHRKINGVSKYTGVCWHKPSRKWLSKIYVNSKMKHLGYFDNELDAHNAYQNELYNITAKPKTD